MPVAVIAACGRLGFEPELGATSDAAAQIGCSDGTREGFTDLATFPTIAGCAATWAGQLDMRLPATGTPCGNGLGACAVPADACAAGWHACTRTGDVTELQVIGPSACDSALAGSGAFAAASSHCLQISPCTYAAAGAWDCSPTASGGHEPICCGLGCTVPANCHDGVWMTDTRQTANAGTGCGAFAAADATGVLCCKD